MVFGEVRVGDDGPVGYSYRAALVHGPRDRVLAAAAAARFSGLVSPAEGPRVVLVPSGEHLLVASGRRDLEALGADLAREHGPVLVVEVVRDRLLSLVLLTGPGPEGTLRYLSDPSVLDPEDLDEPRGAHHAPALARALDSPGVAQRLRDALGEGLDTEQHIESERLERVLGLLGLPTWLVSAWSLPRRVAGGPDPRSFTRLTAGVVGPVGVTFGWAVERWRRSRQRVARLPDGPRPDGLAVTGPSETDLW